MKFLEAAVGSVMSALGQKLTTGEQRAKVSYGPQADIEDEDAVWRDHL